MAFKNRFEGKTVLITGGARGIGYAIAEWFAREGAEIALNDIMVDELNRAVESLRQMGCKAKGYRADVSKASEVEEMVNSIISDFGKIDILVNNAGIALPTKTLELSEEEWDRLININLKGAFLVSKAVLKHMVERRYGRIVMMGSIAGKTGGVATGVHYDVSKAGMIVMARHFAREFGQYGITVNAVAPSFVETRLLEDLQITPERKEVLAKLNVIQRLATPDDVANAVLFLASDQSSFITGETINVNGGRLMD